MFENIDEYSAEVVGKYLAGFGIGAGLYVVTEATALLAGDEGRDGGNDNPFKKRAAQNLLPGAGGTALYNAAEVPMELEYPELTYEDGIVGAGVYSGYTAIREAYRYGYDV